MTAAALPLALLTLVPVMVGPLPQGGETITARLCEGGIITIPVGHGTPPQERACHPKGCHAGSCREDKPAKLILRKDGL
jgi:hypothetical protein